MNETTQTQAQYELNVSRPTISKTQGSKFLIHPSNIGYKLTINGGSIANFALTGFTPCWLNELSMRFNLPEPDFGELGNSNFNAVGNAIRTLAAGVVPHENMAAAEIPAGQFVEELLKVADELDAHYGAELIPIFPMTWVFKVTDPECDVEPAILSLVPTLRESLAGAPAALVEQFTDHLSCKARTEASAETDTDVGDSETPVAPQ